MQEKVVVTGAAGFIGSHLCEALVSNGYRVLGIDDLSVGRRENLKSLEENPNFKLQVGCFYALAKRVVTFKPDYIFHLAALADIVPSIDRPERYNRVNAEGTFRLCLQTKKMKNLKKFIYAASSSCYGFARNVPTSELDPVRPMYPYALTKYLGERYVMHWAQVYGMPAISLRFFNVYGPRARTSGTYGAVFGVFLGQIANSLPLTIVGNGEQTRDFTYITDVIEALLLAMRSDKQNVIYNVGSDATVSVNRVANLLANEGYHREFIPKRPGEPDVTFADISKINRELGYYPKVKIEEGCAEMKKLIPEFRTAPAWTKEKIAQATAGWFATLGGR